MRVLILFICSLICISSYGANVKIGFIDTNQVVTSLSIYKENLKAISNEFEPKKQELLDLFDYIELLRSNIEATKASKTGELLESELSKLSNLEKSFAQETEFWQKTMDNKKMSSLKEIELLINQTINEYAIREKYDLILYENAAFVSNKVNITKEIIAEIEKQEL